MLITHPFAHANHRDSHRESCCNCKPLSANWSFELLVLLMDLIIVEVIVSKDSLSLLVIIIINL